MGSQRIRTRVPPHRVRAQMTVLTGLGDRLICDCYRPTAGRVVSEQAHALVVFAARVVGTEIPPPAAPRTAVQARETADDAIKGDDVAEPLTRRAT